MKLFDGVKRRMKRWGRRISLTKRQQFVIVMFFLAAGLMLTQLVTTDLRYPMVIGLSLFTYITSAIVLREELAGIEWLSLLTLPTLFTASVALFYFLLPARWLTRVPFVVLYGVGMYALLLTENIYNVAADRTIALLRAAHSIGFLLTLVTYFLLVQTVMAFRFPFYINTLAILPISFFLVFQSLWSAVLEEHVSARTWHLTIVVTVVLAELALVCSFLPIKSTLEALFLTTSFYSMVGMAQQYLVEKLYKKTVVEFFTVCAIVFAIVLMTTHWRGNL
ncbi:hypothetical protein A2Z00_02885 [Candidatus Gottesmanbacteria bacterium RBG_13_45_10]|uniref:Uncharacterized protein n=1 Tax=Candidatus Gottesmanbacteria bacterium RBG_13_45_10 TaxID=1798370 RepID=A0A1F5ZH75_9BACT|nr:MAG: hypothetical protein A2Z00_02885 [Candidatus Gottesmanbacteria bacterium RBG_13_45_10]